MTSSAHPSHHPRCFIQELCLVGLILCFIEVKVKKLNKHMKLREKLRGNGVRASRAWGKIEERYEIVEIRQIFEKEGDFSKVY
jgi:hypothetical protein